MKVHKNTPRLLRASGDHDDIHWTRTATCALIILGDSAAAGVVLRTQQRYFIWCDYFGELKQNICWTGNCMQKLVTTKQVYQAINN